MKGIYLICFCPVDDAGYKRKLIPTNYDKRKIPVQDLELFKQVLKRFDLQIIHKTLIK